MNAAELYQLMERELFDPPDVAVEAFPDGALVVVGDQQFWVTAKEES